MVKNYLNALKNKGNFTCAEIANLSGIPEATIRKILSGETDNPRFDTVAKLVTAMGGTMNEVVETAKDGFLETNAIISLKEVYEARISEMKEHVALLRKDKRILAIVSGVLMAVIVCLLIIKFR